VLTVLVIPLLYYAFIGEREVAHLQRS